MTLRPNGDIVMVYVEVQPVLTTSALYDREPVAGISGQNKFKFKNIYLKNYDIICTLRYNCTPNKELKCSTLL